MTSRTCSLCRRATLPAWAPDTAWFTCGDCADRLLAGFGPERREVHVERLSASDPTLQTKGRRAA
jgi:hypothetical protein